jgi:hypothetical protein
MIKAKHLKKSPSKHASLEKIIHGYPLTNAYWKITSKDLFFYGHQEQ